MHVAGSAAECERAGRELRRAAVQVSRTARALQRADVVGWAGTSAQGWERLRSRQVAELDRLADALAAVGRAVSEHAAGLDELQDAARRLAAQAAAAGLLLDGQGWIRPVPLPDSGLPDLLREALQRQESRRRVLAGVAELRARESALHERLLLQLRAVQDGPSSVRRSDGEGNELDVAWLPTWWDAPSAGVSGGQLAAQRVRSLPGVLRHGAGWSGLGFGVGVAVDVRAGRDWDDALTKNVVVTGVAIGAGVLLAPAAAPAAVAVVIAAGGGYVAGRLFDAFGHRLSWVEKPPAAPARTAAAAPAGVRPTPRATPGPAPRPPLTSTPRGVHRAPSSTAAPRPLPQRR